MNNMGRDVANNVLGKLTVAKRASAVAIVFMMVSVVFVTLTSGAPTNPAIWTSQDEYSPGEVVYVYGEGFAAFETVTIEISHPDLETKTYTIRPDLYGRFVFDDYLAEWVTTPDVAVNITATQTWLGAEYVAYTEFYDPAAYIEGWSLKPQIRFTMGDIKGYNEGDSIPFIVVLNKNQLGGQDIVTATLAFDYCDRNSPTMPVFGIDYLTAYHDPTPSGPYNTYPNSTLPFWADPSQGTVISQEFLRVEWEDEGEIQQIMLWTFTLDFNDAASYATVRFGAHLAVTTPERLGASHYPGSALHVRMYELDPSANEGDLNVPIMAPGIMVPPQMNLEKWCDPTEVVYGDTITFTIHYNNTGGADATCVSLWDILPAGAVSIDPYSFLLWTSEQPTKMTPSPGPVVGGPGFDWYIGLYPGTGPDESEPVLETWLEFQCEVITGLEGCYENQAYMSFTDDHGGEFPDLFANCTFCIRGAPEVTVEKSGPAYAHVGDTITYTYNVTNTGDVDLLDVDVVDDVAGAVVMDDSLTVGEYRIYTKTYTVDVADPDPLTNTVTVTAEDGYCRIVTASDSWTVDLLDPEIEVTKTCDPECGEVGEEIHYTVVVTNPSGDTDLYNVTVEDSLEGVLYGGTLLKGSSETFLYTLDATDVIDDPMTNTVTATGEDLLNLVVSDSDSCSVDIYHPMINVTKEADKTCAEVGETVTYWINVTNPSWDTAMLTEVVDEMFDDVPLFDDWLGPGETWESGPLVYTVSQEDNDPLENTVYVEARDVQFHGVSASASWEVDIYHPMISVTKEADKTCAEVGETVRYWINVTNPSTDTPMYAEVYDAMLGGMIWSGDVDNETTVYLGPMPYVVTGGDGDPLVNVVEVNAWDPQEHHVSDSASWTVDILHPAIEVTKEANKVCAEVDEDITYYINITNPSDDTIMNVIATDPMFGGVIFNGQIAPLATVPLTFTYFVQESDPDPLVNEVWVDAWDEQEHYVFDNATWSVDILHPAIIIEKWAEEDCAAEGDTVIYTIVVTNPTDDTWMHYEVNDPLLGGPIGSGSLAPGASDTYTEEYLVPYIPPDPQCWELYNFVEVFAWDNQSHRAYDWAECWVDIYHPAIMIEKWPNMECAAEGDTVIYTIVVSNPTIDTWMYYDVYDTLLGGLIGSGYLAPGASGTYTVPYLVPYIPADPVEWELYNLVEVFAEDDQGHEVYDSAECWVDIYHPAIEIEKWTVETCAAEGDIVTYFIRVTNPTIDTWMTYVVTDEMLGGTIGSGSLGPGESYVYEVDYEVPYMVPDPIEWELYNFVEVDAWDRQDHDAYDCDEWLIDIYHPAIDVEKWTNETCAAEGDIITFVIEVTNPTIDTGMRYDLYDPLLGGYLGSGYLAPGESVVYYEPYAVPYIAPNPQEWELLNEVWVDAWDDQNHYVYDYDEWLIDIYHPGIYVEKWPNMECAAEGDTVIYTIVVSNPTIDTWMYYDVYDTLLGGLIGSGYLAPGASGTYTVPYLVPYIPADPVEWELYNLVEVIAWDDQFHYTDAYAECWVDIYHPDIVVEKSAAEDCAAEDDTVVYTIVVTNPTIDTPMFYDLYDQLLGGWFGSGYLVPGESHTYTGYYTVPYMPPEYGVWELYNEVEVFAYDPQEHPAYDSAECWVDIYHPDIVVEKWSDMQCAAEGEVIVYTIVVTNPTIDTPMYYEVYDFMLGGLLGSGDLDPGANDTYRFNFTVPVIPAQPGVWELFNEVWVDAWDDQGHYVWDYDSCYVDVVHPEVVIDKYSVLTCAHDDERIEYMITVTNVGDTWLNGTVHDDLLGLHHDFYDLRPWDSIYLYPTYVVPVGSEWVINEAWVEAWDHQDHRVTDNATWEVEILHPSVDIVKTGPDYANPGDTITYTVTVTNDGDTELFEVDIYDSLVGPIATGLELGIGDTVVYTYTFVVPAGEGVLENTVTVIGRDRQFVWVDDSDSWTVQKYNKITGYKFADLSRDGVWDLGEPGVQSWVIDLVGVLDGGGYDNRTRITDSMGYYEFTNLEAGVYTVTETMVSGWQSMTATSYTLVVGSGGLYVRSFGNVPMGSISGFKWWDHDLDGVWDEGEEGIPGWMISLRGMDANGDPVSRTTYTDENGSYMFDDLIPGIYTVYEEILGGWYPTTPSSVIVDVSSLVPFEIDGIDFGNAKYGSITGFKWLDEYMNGQWDYDELKLAGWTIGIEGTLANGSHFGPMYTTTDVNGNYAFVGLLPGEYTVWEVIPEGWVNVTPSVLHITLIEGTEMTCAKFGNVEYGEISGWKFLDWDMDGVKDGDEPGIAGWAITLTGWLNDGDWPYPLPGCTDNATYVGPITVYTDPDGYWEFPDLLPGVYRVIEESRDLWYHTIPPAQTVVLGSGTVIYDVKFGNVPYTCLWGFKFEDIDGDGVWDEGEPGLPGWTVVVEGVRNDGVPVYIEMVTDEFGYWETCYNILPGRYIIWEMWQQGWMPTTTDYYEFSPRMAFEPMDYYFLFGNFELGKIFGYKYEDMNGNGVLDDGDIPIEGWTISLSGPMSGSTTTDENGYYEFSGLCYGMYTVTEADRAGWIHTSPTSHSILVTSGAVIEVPVFLNVELSIIWGYKFEDINGDGVWDEGEPGIPGWTIYMIWDLDPTIYNATTNESGYYEFAGLTPDAEYMVWEEERPGWTATTPRGYIFEIVSGSSIRVPDFGNFRHVDIVVFKFEDVNSNGIYDDGDVPLAGWEFIVMGPGVPGGSTMLVTDGLGLASVEVNAAGVYTVEELVQMDWCPTTPPIREVFVLSGMADPEVVMFGNFRCVDITIFKYEDVDSDGVYDPRIDNPIMGWTFTFVAEDQSWFNLTTDANGEIHVTFCEAGEWMIIEEDREGWSPVNPACGSVWILVFSGTAINLDTQCEQYYFEFGNFHCVEIRIFKFWDTCSNGWYDPEIGDVPLPRWYFDIFGPSYPTGADGWTDEGGYLSFMVCRAGTYIVTEEDREGWSHISPLSGFFEVYVDSGDGVIELWFANYLDVDVPIFKYEDVNSNGVYDEGDNPLEGWYFELVRNDDLAVYSGYTGPDGYLNLTVNRSGVYTLTEEDREGWTHINPATGMRLVNVFSGIVIPVQMFGNFEDVDIVIFKFEDVNGDGIYDERIDRPLPGWMMNVTGPGLGDGVEVLTDADGYANVTVNSAGEYVVTEEVRDGWCLTTMFNPVYVRIVSGYAEPQPVMFGNFECVDISIFKYEDMNCNGVYDDGDVAIEDWPIEVWPPESFFDVVYTDENGYANFTACEAGWWYLVEEYYPGWVWTQPYDGYYVFFVQSGAVFETFMFGNFHIPEVTVFKYEDVNSNGVYDDGDVPVDRWYFELRDCTGALIDWGYTGVDGLLTFYPLCAGTFTIIEEDRQGWTHINPATGMMTIDVWSGLVTDPLMFGNFRDVWIPVFKYEDVNSNGVYDEGDGPIPGWNFTISGPGVTNPIATTGGDGLAYFVVNRSGTYTVTEEDKVGWTHVNPADGDLDVYVGSGYCLEPLMFGNFHDVIILIFKFDDIYADGRYYPGDGDVPIAGWTFWLYILDGDEWVLVATTETNATGYASFVVTKAGEYKVEEERRDGWYAILPPTGFHEVEVHSGMGTIELWFANFKMGMIFGWKWNDLDGDGEWDEGEPALPGWRIELEGTIIGGGGALWAWTVTDENGYYQFTGLPPGIYVVSEVMQPGWIPTSPPIAEVVVVGHSVIRLDFFNFEFGCIEGYKYEDMNGNGVYDDGDVPLAGWSIYLSEVTGYLLDMDMTDEFGYYSFCGLGPGVYVVSEESRNGWIPTNDTSETVVMTSGAMIVIHDFMNFELGMICGWKFEDVNSNGIWDQSEEGIEDWPIHLMGMSSPDIETEYTDENGYFCFSGLTADEYIVWEELLSGWTPTTYTGALAMITSGSVVCLDPFGNFENVSIEIFKYEDVNGNGVYDDGDRPIEGWMFVVSGPCFPGSIVVYTDENGTAVVWVTSSGTYTIVEEDREGWMHVNPESGSAEVFIESGDVFRQFRFGNFMLGQITGQKFYDWNLNGVKDEGEYGLANWVVWINGTLVSGGWLNITRLTDSNGYFSVTGLPAGTYVVSERLEYGPAGWVPTTPTTISVLVKSGTFASMSFGNAVFGLITGIKFYDKDMDGFMDEGEPGLAGWTIILEGTTDQGEYVYRTAVTDVDGWYIFDFVQPGAYEVSEYLPDAWMNTTPLPRVVDVSGSMVYFEAWVHIGNVRFALIHGYKFLDTYSDSWPFWPNGQFDEDEYGLGNWEITLQGWTTTGQWVDRVTYTDNMRDIGYYEFRNVLPGTYWVNETLQWGFYATKPVSNLIMVYAFPLGPVEIVIDFGNLIPDVDPELRFVLDDGWNLWSCPMEVDGLTAKGLLEAIGPAGVMVSRYDKALDRYFSYIVDEPDRYDFLLVRGQGYFVYVSADVTFTLTGDLTPAGAMPLESGWNLIGYCQMKPVMASDLLEMVDGAKGWMITYLDPETTRYRSYISGEPERYDFQVTPGRAFFLYVDGPCSIVY